MAVFAGKTQFAQGGGNDYSLLNRMYINTGRVGNVRMVYSGATGSANGISPGDANITLATAQTAAVADNDDLVLVLPGHAETIAGAAGITLSKAGVTYQGVGVGAARPTFTFTATNSQIIVSGARVTLRNMVFDLTGIDAVVAAFSVTAADVAFEDCTFILQAASISVIKAILTAATATRFRVERCQFLGTAVGGTATLLACISHEVGINFIIRDCYFIGKMTQAVLNAATILGGLIARNTFQIYTGTKAIALAAGTTGLGVDNRIVVPSGTAPIVGAGFTWIGNIYGTEALTIGTPTAAAF